eukprot:snap_masked-scaffold_62-processed-gene-0.27-mRNA-1 protein AED:1.00 eAED:1.00 QI:0/0/0/0/1/1/2/0/63
MNISSARISRVLFYALPFWVVSIFQSLVSRNELCLSQILSIPTFSLLEYVKRFVDDFISEKDI